MTINEYKANLQKRRLHASDEVHTKKGETVIIYVRGDYCFEAWFDKNGEQIKEKKSHIWDILK